MAGGDWSTAVHADMAILATFFQRESTGMTSVTT
jgi:crotonobetainyl-CoA:carnitine CoA-transferase CaiB-like acyl-CoA transferase